MALPRKEVSFLNINLFFSHNNHFVVVLQLHKESNNPEPPAPGDLHLHFSPN